MLLVVILVTCQGAPRLILRLCCSFNLLLLFKIKLIVKILACSDQLILLLSDFLFLLSFK